MRMITVFVLKEGHDQIVTPPDHVTQFDSIDFIVSMDRARWIEMTSPRAHGQNRLWYGRHWFYFRTETQTGNQMFDKWVEYERKKASLDA